jgi:hypothetical protein
MLRVLKINSINPDVVTNSHAGARVPGVLKD